MSNNSQSSGQNLQKLLEDIDGATQDCESVTLDAVLDEIGSRSFGPLLLLAGLTIMAPVIGDIPGMPTIVGVFVFLVTIQLLLGRDYLWFPKWMRNKGIAADKLHKSLQRLQGPARFIDRLLRPRLALFATGPAVYAIAAVCTLVALAMPVMEMVPFSANAAGVVLTAFGLSLIARDGLFSLIAFVVTVITAVGVIYNLL